VDAVAKARAAVHEGEVFQSCCLAGNTAGCPAIHSPSRKPTTTEPDPYIYYLILGCDG